MVAKFRWKSSDSELLPQDGKRYEIIDGELFAAYAPHWGHQKTCVRIASFLDMWSLETGAGEAASGPGILFSEADNVIPDVAWVSKDKLPVALNESGHLIESPDLAIEVLSLGAQNIRRDRELKLRLYSVQGVREYWILDWRLKQVSVYRRTDAQLMLVATLTEEDVLTSPMLPGFLCPLTKLFA